MEPLLDGRVRKGGQNPPLETTERPAAPKGSGGCCEMRGTLLVIPPGEKVSIGPEEDGIEGTVIQLIVLGPGMVRYLIGWFNGRNYEEEWLESFMVRPIGSRYRRIGFASEAR